jgi:hypothetical protein
MNKSKSGMKKLLAGCFSVLLMSWALPYSSDLQAGQTYYYDKHGNLISAEEYEKLRKELNGKKNVPAVQSEESETSSQNPAQDDGSHNKQPVEPQTRDDEDSRAATDDDENSAEEDEDEEEDNEAQYRVEVSSETLSGAFRRDTDNEDDSLVVPVYEYLRMDFGALEQGGLSFHLYGWGRYDLKDSGN